MRLSEATTRFGRQLAANGCSTHTRAAYRRDLRTLAAWLTGNPTIGRISPDALARFLASSVALETPNGDPRAAITVNRVKSALCSFCAFCMESGRTKPNSNQRIRSSPTTETRLLQLIEALLVLSIVPMSTATVTPMSSRW